MSKINHILVKFLTIIAFLKWNRLPWKVGWVPQQRLDDHMLAHGPNDEFIFRWYSGKRGEFRSEDLSSNPVCHFFPLWFCPRPSLGFSFLLSTIMKFDKMTCKVPSSSKSLIQWRQQFLKSLPRWNVTAIGRFCEPQKSPWAQWEGILI